MGAAMRMGAELSGGEFPISVFPHKIQHIITELHASQGYPIDYIAATAPNKFSGMHSDALISPSSTLPRRPTGAPVRYQSGAYVSCPSSVFRAVCAYG